MLAVTPELRIPLREFEITFARSGGPGGQNVNKVNSKATLRWHVRGSRSLPEAVRERFLHKYAHRLTIGGEIVVTSQRFRDAGRNVADCVEKLRLMLLAVAVPPKPRRPTRPSRGSIERRLQAKHRRAKTKEHRHRGGEE